MKKHERILSGKDMVDKPRYGCTVGQLREHMRGLSDDVPVFYQRIEDSYFTEKSGWRTLGMHWDYNSTTEYIRAFYGGSRKAGNKTIFVIEAHY